MIDWKRFVEDDDYLYDEDDEELLYKEIQKLKPEDYYFQLSYGVGVCGTTNDHYFSITPRLF